VFAETRLRRGAYGQRYDNGQRYDGTESRKLPFADKPTKGPGTMWDAPGMLRIKIPGGGLNPRQLEVMAELAEEYSDGIAHVTTRQDFQLHFIHIENGPSIMRRLASVGITTREACGNAVRNVTACPLAGVCRDEAFDVGPYFCGPGVVSDGAPGHDGVRAQVQAGLQRMRPACLRPHPDARHWLCRRGPRGRRPAPARFQDRGGWRSRAPCRGRPGC
jgi:hypothetical protein